jgi:fumarate hydratase class II
MHIAAVLEIHRLLPRVRSLQQAIATKAKQWNSVVKIGRTHLEDAVPLTVGQESEAMVMVCIQVIADDNGVAFAGSQGNFQLNAMRPIVINNFVHSARILGDASSAMTRHRPSPTTPTAADALCGRLPWTAGRSVPKTSTESSTRPTWLARSGQCWSSRGIA